MKNISLLILVLFYLHATYSLEKKLPSFVKVCKRYDPELSECWRSTLENLRPYLAKGIPEFKVPPTEPFHIESLLLNQTNTRTLQFFARLTNLSFTGGKDFDVISAHADYKKLITNSIMYFPHLALNGQYTAKGKVLLFEFDSSGEVEGDFKGVTVNGTYFLETYQKEGVEYLRIKSSTQDVQIKNIYLYLHDLFKNNPEITENVNKAINDNIDLLYNDFKPLLGTTIGTIFTDYSNRAYSQYPFDVFLPIN